MTLTARELLSDSGPIAARVRERFGAFESRPEQLAMVASVARSLEQRGTLVVEAGTGVGKSFAYLVPAIVRAVTTGQKVVVATATIALQEQLVQKDIPMLRAALGLNDDAAPGSSVLGAEARFPLVPVLAKGRGNYVSIRRLKLASQRQDALLHDEQQRRSLHVIEDWAYTTTDGSLASLPALERPEVWDHARSDADNCMGRKCPHFKECFYQSARRELERANLIVCNHALFFSDLALRSRGVVGASVLPAYDHVILDEAHNVEDAACEHFGLSLAEPRVMRLLRTLFSPKRRKGYLLDRGLSLGHVGAVDRALTLVQEAEHASHELFAGLYDFHQRHRSSSGRLRAPGSEIGIDNPLSPAMSQLAICLRRIRDAIESEQDRFELSSFARRAADIADTAEAMVEQTLNGYVYWIDVERESGGGGGATITRARRVLVLAALALASRSTARQSMSLRCSSDFCSSPRKRWRFGQSRTTPTLRQAMRAMPSRRTCSVRSRRLRPRSSPSKPSPAFEAITHASGNRPTRTRTVQAQPPRSRHEAA